MAVSPKQLNEEFQREVDAYESALDAKLSQKQLVTGGYLNIDIPRGMTTDHFKIIRQRYLDVGWRDVKLESDQREGQWLVFKS